MVVPANLPELRVLRCLALKGVADSAAVASATGLPLDAVEREANALLADEAAVRREGPIAGWQLTRVGRERQRVQVEAVLAAADRAAVERCYSAFLPLNDELREVCAALQVQRDDRSVSRLRDVHARIDPIVSELGRVLVWFDQYGRRLGAALAQVDRGDSRWIASPLVDSYHTVWFELHEDLLSTLRLERIA
jgi:hypothetical protein